MTGPLSGVRVLEFAGIGPGPHACTTLADLGADVVRVLRPGAALAGVDITTRGRRLVELDLRSEHGVAQAAELVGGADVLVEGFRPGVMERLGLGPERCAELNRGLVYARMTGWGQDGPSAQRVGHDINYLAVSGLLDTMRGADGTPVPPHNLVGDYGGGSMLLVAGVLAALVERGRTGRGQTVDVAMTDGIGLLARVVWAFRAAGTWVDAPNANLLDGGEPYYRCYRCADGRFIAVGAIEPAFYSAFVETLGFDEGALPDREVPENRSELARLFADRVGRRPRDEWAAVFEDVDACVTPVLSLAEAPDHPHARARAAYPEFDGGIQPAPAPRFSRSTVRPADPPPPGRPVTVPEVVAGWRP